MHLNKGNLRKKHCFTTKMSHHSLHLPRWKTLLISNDGIHVQAKVEDNNAEGIHTLKSNDYLRAVHDVW